jgi:hypothetical protein
MDTPRVKCSHAFVGEKMTEACFESKNAALMSKIWTCPFKMWVFWIRNPAENRKKKKLYVNSFPTKPEK